VRVRAIACAAAFATATLGALARVDAIGTSSAPIRHLTYAFTYSSESDETYHDSGISPASGLYKAPVSGVADYTTALDDKGTIVVDVVAIQPDNGLIVRVSEDSRKQRDAAPANCLVYGNTDVVCEPDAKINAEEFAVIRLLGRNFADPSKVDANGHWRESRSTPAVSVVSEFAIDKSSSGVLHISTQRVTTEHGAQGFTASAVGKIVYDVYRTLPTSVTDDEITRQEEGGGQHNTTRVQTSLTLTSDSMAGP
jgi:hypothetical protein